MAMALRILGRRALRRTRPSLSSSVNPPLSLLSPAGNLIGEASLLKSLTTFSLSQENPTQCKLLPSFWTWKRSSSVQLCREFSTGGAEHSLEEGTNVEENTKSEEVIRAPRPFRLTENIRKLAEEVGYRVINRYTAGDFGRNKRPKTFAVVQIGAHQFKVSPGDLIYTEKLKFCDINDKLMLNKVLLLGSKTQTFVGRPTVPKSAVFAVVEEHALDEKVIIFKKKRRKNYRRTTGHRQELTRLRILDIKGITVEESPPSKEIVSKKPTLKDTARETGTPLPASELERDTPVLA